MAFSTSTLGPLAVERYVAAYGPAWSRSADLTRRASENGTDLARRPANTSGSPPGRAGVRQDIRPRSSGRAEARSSACSRDQGRARTSCITEASRGGRRRLAFSRPSVRAAECLLVSYLGPRGRALKPSRLKRPPSWPGIDLRIRGTQTRVRGERPGAIDPRGCGWDQSTARLAHRPGPPEGRVHRTDSGQNRRCG